MFVVMCKRIGDGGGFVRCGRGIEVDQSFVLLAIVIITIISIVIYLAIAIELGREDGEVIQDRRSEGGIMKLKFYPPWR